MRLNPVTSFFFVYLCLSIFTVGTAVAADAKCPPHCQTCTSDGKKCLKCAAGYRMGPNTVCYPCPDNCIFCEHSTKCITCADGFYLRVIQCHPCKKGCKTCETVDICTSCSDGSRVDSLYRCNFNRSGISFYALIGLLVGGSILVLALVVAAYLICRWKKNRQENKEKGKKLRPSGSKYQEV